MELLHTDACTLPTAERPLRLAELAALFAASARTVSSDQDGVRIHLVGAPGLRARVEDLAARETACCSFFSFGIEGEDDDLVLTVAVPQERRSILDGLAARARQLSD